MNDPPEISDIGNQSTSEGELKKVEFPVDEGGGKIEDVQVLSIAVVSSNQKLVPDDAIRLSFSDDDSDADKGHLAITPTAGVSGSSQITLTLSDGVDAVDTSFTFSVGSVNDPPTISAISDQELDEDSWIDSIAFTVDEGGAADEDVQILKISAASSNPELISGDDIQINFRDDESDADRAALSLRPLKNESGEATITVTVNDGTESVTESFTLKVLPVNDPPIASSGDFKTVEDVSISRRLEAADIEGDDVTYVIREAPKHGELELTNHRSGRFEYIPTADWSGTDEFSYTVNDGAADSEVALVSIHVDPVNDPPEISDIGSQSISEGELKRIEFTVDEGGGDIEDVQVLSIVVASSNQELVADDAIRLSFSDDDSDADKGHLVITPAAGVSGSSQIMLTLSDGVDAVDASFTFSVGSVNDPPTVSTIPDQELDEDSWIDSIAFTVDEGGGADEDVQILKISAVSSNPDLISGDDIQINFRDDDSDASGGILSLRPLKNASGEATITVTVDDGIESATESFKLRVLPVNDPPEISDIGKQSTSEGELKIVKFTVDEGGGEIEDVQVISITVTSSNQELVPDNAIRLSFSDDNSDADKGRLAITPAAGASGSSQITLTVSDGVDVVDASFTLSVGSVNDPPTASAIADQELDEDSWIDSIAFTVDEGGGADEDAQILKISAVSSNPDLVSGDDIKINFHDDGSDAEGGMLSIRPLKNASGEATITVTVDDGTESVTESFTLKVLPVNDPPIASSGDFRTMGDMNISRRLEASDIEGDDVTYVIRDVPEHGELELTNHRSGRFEYIPSADWSGTDAFSYYVNDGIADSESALVSIHVDPVNDLPEISDIGNQSISEGEMKRIEFTVDEGGGEIEDVQVVSIAVASSNQELVRDDAIILSFSDDDSDADKGRLAITPIAGASGSSQITLLTVIGWIDAAVDPRLRFLSAQ